MLNKSFSPSNLRDSGYTKVIEDRVEKSREKEVDGVSHHRGQPTYCKRVKISTS